MFEGYIQYLSGVPGLPEDQVCCSSENSMRRCSYNYGLARTDMHNTRKWPKRMVQKAILNSFIAIYRLVFTS